MHRIEQSKRPKMSMALLSLNISALGHSTEIVSQVWEQDKPGQRRTVPRLEQKLNESH